MLHVMLVLGMLGLSACDQSDPEKRTRQVQAVPSPPTLKTNFKFHQLTPDIFVGPRPSQEHIAELAMLGIKKVISVDALPPESNLWSEAIEVRHLPLGYRDLPKSVQLRLARELLNDPVKTYIHCHHGRDGNGCTS